MLQDQLAVDEVEAAVGEIEQVRRAIQHEATALATTVVASREPQHPRRDVDAHDLVEAVGERAGHPADAAAEIERAPAAEPDAARTQQRLQRGDFQLSPRKELLERPAAALLVGRGEHRPERVTLGELVPMKAQPRQTQGGEQGLHRRGELNRPPRPEVTLPESAGQL